MGKNKKHKNAANFQKQPIRALDKPTIKRTPKILPEPTRYLLDINSSGEGFKSMVYHTFFYIFMILLVPLALIISRVLNRRIRWFDVGPVPKERMVAKQVSKQE